MGCDCVKIDYYSVYMPMTLELSAGETAIILANDGVFRKNGFVFAEHEDGSVRLTSAPMINSNMLGKDDIMEILHVLGETEGVNVRPTRVLQWIASKACRKSTMIGDSLQDVEMATIITQMAGLIEPWVQFLQISTVLNLLEF
ncbi:putative Mismatch repair endonuclease PMS2 [Hypsibius exemplaris]|uniref:Mismatch repair endonuclease PMS2 n=1 Tax=Hypsibius exemplaris TaxID=2072580 RepID=A0A9X6NNA9_HYPEX|nr:putative Mismatch repair endonuclease PMS2 [Hypsibius exemplaris]